MDASLPDDVVHLLQLVAADKPVSSLEPHELALLGDSETLLCLLGVGMAMPEDVNEQIADRFIEYLGFCLSEVRIRLRGENDPELLEAIEMLFNLGGDDLNSRMTYRIFREMKQHQFEVDQSLLSELGDNIADQVFDEATAQNNPLNELPELLKQSGIDNGFHFAVLFSADLALLPAEGVEQILLHTQSYPWTVDAMLLLAMHPEQHVAETAAAVLNGLPAKKWKQLSNSNYLTLAQRFGMDSLKSSLPQWQKLAMKHGKQRPAQTIERFHVSFIDSNQAMMFVGLMREGNRGPRHQFSGVLRVGCGVVDAYFQPDVGLSEYKDFTGRLLEEMAAVECDPLLLSQLVPWMLVEQQQNQEALPIEALQMLSALPSKWIEPQPFSLDAAAAACQQQSLSAKDIECSRMRSHRLLSAPGVEHWLIDNIAPGLKNARQVRQHHYLNRSDVYIKALAMTALVMRYSQEQVYPGVDLVRELIAAAYLLQQGGLERKKFPLFDELAEISLVQYQQQDALRHVEANLDSPKGCVIKIELMDSKPKVWRRFTVSNALDLESFHYLLQDIMGWENAHSFMFRTQMGNLDYEAPLEQIPLMAVLQKPGDSLLYHYDFGDDWQHLVTLEKLNQRDCHTPKITAGRGACPPEDCGGVWGYQEMLALRKVDDLDEDEAERLECYGIDKDFDPAAFDKAAVNLGL